jgi:PKHD-type hydroxylase
VTLYVLPSFLSPTECEAALALFPPTAPAVVNASTSSVSLDRAVRRSRVSFLTDTSPESKALVARLTSVLLQVNERHFGFELDGAEPPQLAEYREGDGYRWHLDLGPGSASRRKLSASVQLSKPSNYSGGALEIFGSGAVDHEQGTLAVFPSYLLHRVAPVERGVRKSLVVWATGKRAFR